MTFPPETYLFPVPVRYIAYAHLVMYRLAYLNETLEGFNDMVGTLYNRLQTIGGEVPQFSLEDIVAMAQQYPYEVDTTYYPYHDWEARKVGYLGLSFVFGNCYNVMYEAAGGLWAVLLRPSENGIHNFKEVSYPRS
jgi:hypothetical protein